MQGTISWISLTCGDVIRVMVYIKFSLQHRQSGLRHERRSTLNHSKWSRRNISDRHTRWREWNATTTTDLLKVKTFHDAEAYVTGFENGTGRNNGRVGALYCTDIDGITFKVGTGLKDYMRDKPPAIGTRITYKYQEKTRDGKPRFPVFLRERPTEWGLASNSVYKLFSNRVSLFLGFLQLPLSLRDPIWRIMFLWPHNSTFQTSITITTPDQLARTFALVLVTPHERLQLRTDSKSL